MHMIALLPFQNYPDPGSGSVTRNAVAVTNHLGAALHALSINVAIPHVSTALSGYLLDLPQRIRTIEAEGRAHAKALLELVRKEALNSKCVLTCEEISAAPALMGEVAAENARYYDISLVGVQKDNPTSRLAAEAIIFGSGRPVLLLPEPAALGTISHIVIAWDGSRSAARAVADAKPFLDRAALITVVTITDEKVIREHDAAERLAAGLRQRGFYANAASILTEDCPIAQTLQDHALELDGNLLIMGGYGHSRIRDFVLGGATEGVLQDLRLPILLSH
jgi:nucleotide-binding universal stress UspA family protein